MWYGSTARSVSSSSVHRIVTNAELPALPQRLLDQWEVVDGDGLELCTNSPNTEHGPYVIDQPTRVPAEDATQLLEGGMKNYSQSVGPRGERTSRLISSTAISANVSFRGNRL